FSNEHVTDPPAVTTKLDGVLPVPVQLELVRSHPVWAVSARLYVPGSLFVNVWLAVFAAVVRVSPVVNPDPVFVYAKVPVPPRVCLLTMIVASCCVFVNVHVTFSPSLTLIVAVRFRTVESESLHESPVS